MTTSITTFQKAKTGSLEFPFVSRFGLIDNPLLITYIEDMEAEGHDWTGPEIAAFSAYLTAGQNGGWLEHTLWEAPLWGSATAPSCLRVPLVCKGTDNSRFALIGSPSEAYGTQTDWSVFADASETEGTRLIGAKQPGDRVILPPHSLWDMFTKSGEFDHEDLWKWTWLWAQTPIASVGDTQFSLSGCGGNEVFAETPRLIHFEDTSNSARSLALGAGVASIANLTAAYGSDDHLFAAGVRTGGAGGSGRQAAAYAGELATAFSAAADTADLISALWDNTVIASETNAKARRWAWLARQNNNATTNAPLTISGNTDVALRWLTLDDGWLIADTARLNAKRTALGALFAALGKDYS